MTSAHLQSIHGAVPFTVPAQWQVLTHAAFSDLPAKGTAGELVAKALSAPVNALPLNKRLAADNTVAIIVEDLTRCSPKKEILPVLLEELDAIGIPPDNICIVIALGTHRALSKKELASGYGADITARYRFINHDCHAPDQVAIGELQTGGIVKINRYVYEADFRIGIGSIFPHPLNGFGGGGKILFPGVADFESIFEHHLKYSFVGQARLGNIDGNEFFQEVTRLALAGRLDFIINSVLDHRDRLYDLVCGDPEKAHEVGTRICKRAIAKEFDRPADVTIISAYPYTEGPQIMKPLAPALDTTRKGGCIILYADCCAPLPEIYFDACQRFRIQHGADLRQAVLSYFADNRPILTNQPPELNMSLAQVLLAVNDYHVILVSKDIPKKNVEQLGFLHAPDLKDAITKSSDFFTSPTAHIIPSGGIILPVVQ
ncbi:MAG: lactate racemase domain-containing protein [Desulfobacteraceae bacterium]|jgi:nickel-dependent lactate racemase